MVKGTLDGGVGVDFGSARPVAGPSMLPAGDHFLVESQRQLATFDQGPVVFGPISNSVSEGEFTFRHPGILTGVHGGFLQQRRSLN